MIKETVKYPEFSEIDFIRLYCAMNFKNGCSPIIKHYELEKKLYRFYLLTEFRDLFQDICPKIDYTNSENSYLNLETALNTAQLVGLLIPIQSTGEISSIISCNDKIAQEIISSTDTKMVNKMSKLFNLMLDFDSSSKENHFYQTSDAGLVSDKQFIDEQVESYTEALNSPVMPEIQESGPVLIKKMNKDAKK